MARRDPGAATAARRCAFEVVRRVFERDAYADRALRSEAERAHLAGRERAFAMRLSYGVVQRRATLDHLIERFAERPAAELEPPLLAALRLGVYQLLYMEGVADHAAVSESVELAKAAGGGAHRLANAVLRRAAREGPRELAALADRTAAEAAIRHSHPRWIAELWFSTLGRDEAIALMKTNNEPAESALRANTLRTDAAAVVSALAREGVRATTDPTLPEAVVLGDPYDVHGSALFATGAVMPQSRASMLVAHALDPQPGEAVLDLCAAPGAKTTQIAALMRDEGRVVAVDLDPARLAAIGANRARLGTRCVEPRQGDASAGGFGDGFDRVLVDPPCSDLGTLQSRPDARWRKRPRQVQELAALQSRMLDAGAAALRPGGRLVYSTCTISPEENERQIERFLERRPRFSVADLSAAYPGFAGLTCSGLHRLVQTMPHRHGTDGFFIAALEAGS